ncbi:MAG: PilZ domain-containing protein [Proteobacteria bacterium]|nr:PilZ domain-containing protein [Pseudomonadota bacterium]
MLAPTMLGGRRITGHVISIAKNGRVQLYLPHTAELEHALSASELVPIEYPPRSLRRIVLRLATLEQRRIAPGRTGLSLSGQLEAVTEVHQRKDFRVALVLPVRVHAIARDDDELPVPPEHREATTLDVSACGLRLATAMTLVPGDQLQLELAAERGPITVGAVVRWAHGAPRSYGVRFTSIGRVDQLALVRLVLSEERRLLSVR